MAARVEAEALHSDILGQIAAECGDAAWFTMAAPDGRRFEGRCGRIQPIPAQQQWARDLCDALNRHADLDGAWIVAWCDPVVVVPPAGLGVLVMRRAIPTRAVWMHKDRDGDIDFSIDTEDSLTDIMRSSLDERVDRAIFAAREVQSIEADVGIDRRHKRLAAQGQAPANPRIKYVPYT